MRISKTVSTGLDACDFGAGESVEGTSPARAELEKAQARAIANTKRFIFGFSLELRMQDYL
jgi:hypothetical protein